MVAGNNGDIRGYSYTDTSNTIRAGAWTLNSSAMALVIA